MIVPDVNLLIYSYDTSSPHHAAAVAWLEERMNGGEEIGLATVVIFGFVRISTSSRVFRNPLSVAEATEKVESWLERPHVHVIEPSPHHVRDVLSLLADTGTAANLTTDAQIAALALQEKAVIHSNDTDFLRFPGVRLHNPLLPET